MKRKLLWFFAIVLLLCGCACGQPNPAEEPITCEEYLSIGEETEIFRDETVDYGENRNVTVAFKRTDGPTTLSLKMIYTDSGGHSYEGDEIFPIGLQGSATFSIPAGCSYCIQATGTEGKHGYVKLEISQQT